MTTEFIILLIVVAIELQLLTYFWLSHKRRTPRTKLDNPVFIDTSVLIDGRIIAAVKTGFIPQQLVIPTSVLQELQLLADGGDSEKRLRARQGLELVKQLQELSENVTTLEDGNTTTGVDDRLMELAKKYSGTICTIDYNLVKRAEAEQLPTMNINELAKSLRMNYLPGDKLSLEIVTKGNDSTQGVGYLADGTMVVVERAKADIGKTVEVEFIRSIQTAAGRMFFAKKIAKTKSASPRPRGRDSESSLIDSISKQHQ